MGYQLLFANNAVGTLATACSATATTMQLTAGQPASFPTPGAGQAFYAVVQNGSVSESVLVTNNVGNVFTVVRGQEGTTAQAFPIGAIIEMRFTAAVLANFIQSSSASFAASAGSAAQTFDVADAGTPTNAVPLGQAEELFAGIASIPAAGQLAQPGDIKYSAVSGVLAGWLVCDGSAVSRAAYPALFAAINTDYGAGDGATTFNLPDPRGIFIRGYDHGRGINPGQPIGGYQADSFGAHTHANTLNDPTHDHGFYDPGHDHGLGSAPFGAGGFPAAGLAAGSAGVTAMAATGAVIVSAATNITITNASSGGAETAPKSIAFTVFIKT